MRFPQNSQTAVENITVSDSKNGFFSCKDIGTGWIEKGKKE